MNSTLHRADGGLYQKPCRHTLALPTLTPAPGQPMPRARPMVYCRAALISEDSMKNKPQQPRGLDTISVNVAGLAVGADQAGYAQRMADAAVGTGAGRCGVGGELGVAAVVGVAAQASRPSCVDRKKPK